jgi:mitochondrial import inner membrane translocase subunit TIM9
MSWLFGGGGGGAGGGGSGGGKGKEEQMQQQLLEAIDKKQRKEQWRQFHTIVDRCFNDCATNMRTQKLTSKEELCLSRCTEKYLRHQMLVGKTFTEMMQKPDDAVLAAAIQSDDREKKSSSSTSSSSPSSSSFPSTAPPGSTAFLPGVGGRPASSTMNGAEQRSAGEKQ